MGKRKTKLPSKVDLRDRCGPIVDQGELGSDAACAFAGMMEFQKRNSAKRKKKRAALILRSNEIGEFFGGAILMKDSREQKGGPKK